MPGMKSLPLPEVLALLKKLPVKYQAICAIGVTTGCRITEILRLRRFDLLTRNGKLKENIMFVKLKAVKRPRRGRRREAELPAVPVRHRKLGIPPAFRQYILRHLRDEELRGYDRPDDYVFRGQLGRPLSRQTVYNVFRRVLGEGHGTHWMRKTFARELYDYYLRQNSQDPMRALELVRRALDHARIDTTVKYLGIMESSLQEAQNAIFK